MGDRKQKTFWLSPEWEKEFSAAVEQWRIAGAVVSDTDVIRAGLLMWLRAPRDQQAHWLGQARTRDLDRALAAQGGHDAATNADGAERGRAADEEIGRDIVVQAHRASRAKRRAGGPSDRSR